MLKSGYSYETIVGNVAQLIADGMTRTGAIARAYNLARKTYFSRYPVGALPVWLSYPPSRRVKQYYNADGSPLDIAQAMEDYKNKRVRSNPTRITTKETGEDFHKAKALFHAFTGREPSKLTNIRIPAPPKVALAFGTLVELTYQSERDGRLYRHTFRKKSRPLVVASPDGKQLQIVGGRFAFTDRGIVDK